MDAEKSHTFENIGELLDDIRDKIRYDNAECGGDENIIHISFDNDGYHYVFHFLFDHEEHEAVSFSITITDIDDNSTVLDVDDLGTDGDALFDSSFDKKYDIEDIKRFLDVKLDVCDSFKKTRYAKIFNVHRPYSYTLYPILNERILKKYGLTTDVSDLNGEWLKLDVSDCWDDIGIIMEIGKFQINNTTRDKYSENLFYYLLGKRFASLFDLTFTEDFIEFMRFIDSYSYQ